MKKKSPYWICHFELPNMTGFYVIEADSKGEAIFRMEEALQVFFKKGDRAEFAIERLDQVKVLSRADFPGADDR
jgi:hypothetical protein